MTRLNGKTAVLVHGVPDTHRVWDRVRAQLTRKDVVALALPGFDNPAPAGFTSTKEAYADWIIQQLETIGTPVDLVGHDWGCMLTARVASIRPDLVRTWTGISGPIDPGYEWYEIAKIWQTPGEGERWMAELDLDAFAEQLTSNFRVPSEEARIAVRHFDDAMKASILALYRSAVHVGAEWSPALANVAAPALVMWGIEDALLPHRFADSLGEATHARAVVKLRTAHWPFLEQPADVARELEAHWNGETSVSTQENVQVVKDFFAAMGGDKRGLLALSAEDIEWIIPGEDWPLAGTHRGHAGLADVLQKASETMETSFSGPPEYVAQGDRVLMIGSAKGKVKATNKTFEDDWVFAITVRNGKVTNIREYIDTQALARASEMAESPRPSPIDTDMHIGDKFSDV